MSIANFLKYANVMGVPRIVGGKLVAPNGVALMDVPDAPVFDPSIGIMAASQPPVAIYSLRKVNPNYAGACLQVRDSTNTLRTVGFDVEGDIDQSQFATWGDGVTFTVATWYDQGGGARNVTSTVRPVLILNAFMNAKGKLLPAIDWTSKSHNMTSAATFLNIGGTANLAALVIAGVYGWSSGATHPRSPAVYSAAVGSILGYGTATSGILIASASGTLAETAMYNKLGTLHIEDGTPTNSRLRNMWFNQRGALVSGGADTRKLFADEAHGVTAATAQRLVMGNNGAVTQSNNGPIFEVVLYQSDVAMSDDEVQAISLGQRKYWGDLGAANYPERYYAIASGQSLMQYMGTVVSASTGVLGDSAAQRVFIPTVRSLLDMTNKPNRELIATFSNTAIGGSSILKTNGQTTPNGAGGTSWNVWDGADSATKFWWDQFNNIPGPVLQTWMAQIPMSGYVGAAKANTAILWDQGQAEASYFSSTGESAGLTVEDWATYTKVVWQYMRNFLGANVRIYIQPLGRQTGCDAFMREMRLMQATLAAEVTNCVLGVDNHDCTRQDTVHLAAGPADPNGFDAAATRLARGFVGQFDTTVKHQSPVVASAIKSGANTVDVALSWGSNAAGTDFGPAADIVGMELRDGTGLRTLASAVRLNANTIRLTASGAALSGIVTVAHNPQVHALDRTKMVVDNVGLPLKPSVAITAA